MHKKKTKVCKGVKKERERGEEREREKEREIK